MKEIRLTQDKVALVDDEDFERINQHRWHAAKVGRTYYARRALFYTANKTTWIYIHQQVMSIERKQMVDHKDRDGLNNQKENLRFCTHAENMRNKSPKKNGASKYLGVVFEKDRNLFKASISHNKKYLNLGRFKDETQAALAYNKKASELYGEFANINIV